MKSLKINLILFFVILFWAAIISRLVFLQIIHRDFYKAQALGQQKTLTLVEGKRGEIFIQDKEENLIPLAINKNWPLVFCSPNEIKDKKETARHLSNVLNLDENLIFEKLKSDSFYVKLKDKLTEEEVSKIKELNLTGVYADEILGRYYPQESLASQVIGFLNENREGQYGLEYYYNEILKGEKEFQERSKNPWGYLVSLTSKNIQEGSDLILTIDYNIQFEAERLLEKAKNDFEIESGQILVIDPNSGKIFAMANFPNFDPNKYRKCAKEDFGIFKNKITQTIFEPGSVFKPITMAAALNEEKISPQTTYTDPGIIETGGWPIYNYAQRTYPGKISMTEVLEKSINTGAVFAERQLGHENFLKYIEKFGIFERTGIDLEGEALPQNKEFKQGRETNFATASYGQGIEMSPIQLARAFCAIANGGKLIKPYLVEKIVQNGEIIETKPQVDSQRIIAQKTDLQLITMLVSVVENAFTKRARIPGYYIAGKTGTAQVSFAALEIEKRGYSDKTWQTFTGFAPAFDSKFLILVKLDNPKTKTSEYSAVPIFHDLAKYIIDYWQIPPDYE